MSDQLQDGPSALETSGLETGAEDRKDKQEGPLEAIRRVDKLIKDTAGEIVARVRQAENLDDIVFQGNLTREQIQEQFTVTLTGDETYASLRQKVGTINTLYNRATWNLMNADIEFRRVMATLDQTRAGFNRDLLLANTTSRRNDKISDKAREELTSQIYKIDGVAQAVSDMETEVLVWKQVVKDLDKAFERVQQNMQALASEHKYTREAPTWTQPA